MEKKRLKAKPQPDLRVLPEEETPRLVPDQESETDEVKKSAAPSYAGKSAQPVLDFDTAAASTPTQQPKSMAAVLEPEEAWGAEQKKGQIPSGWLVLGGALILGIAVWVLVSLNQSREVVSQNLVVQKEIEHDREQEDRQARDSLDALRSSVTQFFAAKSAADLLPHVRQQGRVKPLLESYYQAHTFQPRKFVTFSSLNALVLSTRPFLLAECQLENGETQELLLEDQGGGKYLADWETYVHYQPMPWEDFLDQRPSKPLNMRVVCKKDNFYAYEFRDEAEYQCYRLTARDFEGYVYGYVPRRSKLNYQLDSALKNSSRIQPMILRLRYPEGGNSKRAVLIDAVLSKNWTYVTEPEF
ncbi:hypothetical protein JIN77_07675 [Verrucomicrobiaceae bacterium R5-34]|nr:hypothetical protein [Verrucomicrobiaceae bacterium R5-34]